LSYTDVPARSAFSQAMVQVLSIISAACKRVIGQAKAETSVAGAVNVKTSNAACWPREATISITLEPKLKRALDSHRSVNVSR